MNRSEHLLTCLSEECAEVSQRVSKALRFGLSEIQIDQDKTNAQRIEEELCDLFAVVAILEDEGILKTEQYDLPEWIEKKRAKIERYMEISRTQGVLVHEGKGGEDA